MTRWSFLLEASAVLVIASPVCASTPCDATLTGAHVWDGAAFQTRSLSIRDGVFVALDKKLPVVDASPYYLIPPFADAHTHTIDEPQDSADKTHARNIAAGVFYALNPNNIRTIGPNAAPTDTTVELQAAGGGITRVGGHPHPLYSFLAGRGYLGALKEADLGGRAFHEVSTPAEAREAVRAVKANGASVVKLYLLAHGTAHSDGLTEENFRAAADEARKVGLRPIVHIETASDFRLAVDAHVAAIVHLPYKFSKTDPTGADLMITAEDAQAAAAAKIVVVPTLTAGFTDYDGAKLAVIETVQRHNLVLLRDANVQIAIGADNYRLGLHDELTLMRATALFEGPALINMATTNGVKLAFAGRRLGALEPGSEASFIAFFQSPMSDWTGVRTPVEGMRAGHVLIDDIGLLAAVCKATKP
jgi:imidazolonepropionase-like amidohydrolase